MGMGAGRERNDHAEHGREARHPMLTRFGTWAETLALLLVPVTVTDPRAWHWQSAPQTPRPIASLVAWSALFVARLQVAGIYFDSSLAKLATPVWADGTAFYYWSTDPAF